MASTHFYKQRAEEFQTKVRNSDKVISQYSLARILLALLIIFVAYFGFSNSLFFFALPVLIVLFFYLVQVQIRKEYDRKILLHLVDLNNWEAAALEFHFTNFPSGEKYINPHHPYSHDLDIFGQG